METRRKPPIAGKRGKRGRRNEREKKKIKNKKTCSKRWKGEGEKEEGGREAMLPFCGGRGGIRKGRVSKAGIELKSCER